MGDGDPIATLITFAREERIWWVQACSVFEVPLPRDRVLAILAQRWQARRFTPVEELSEEQVYFTFRCEERALARFAIACAAGIYAADYRELDKLGTQPAPAELFHNGRLRIVSGTMLLQLEHGVSVKIVSAVPSNLGTTLEASTYLATYFADKQAEGRPPSQRDAWRVREHYGFRGTRGELEAAYPKDRQGNPGNPKKVRRGN